MPRRWQARRRLLVGSLAAGVLALALPSPAVAYLRDFYASQLDSPLNSDSRKQLNANCPRATSERQVVLGRGGLLHPLRTLGINRLTSGGTGDLGITAAAEVNPENGKWLLSGQVFCATPTQTAPAGSNAAVYLKDVYTRRSHPYRNSLSPKVNTVLCSGRDVAIGGGFRIIKEPRVVARFIQVFKNGAENGVRVAAHETRPTQFSWAVASHVICANVTDAHDRDTYLDKLTIRTEQRPETSGPAKDLHATCPKGQVIVGGGAQAFRFAGPAGAPPRSVMLTASLPTTSDRLPGDPPFAPNEWFGRAVEIKATDLKWGLEVRAVCATLNGPAKAG
jgi:hypothetical protein